MNRRQQDAIAYLQVENRILREKLGKKRLLLNVSQKRRLATATVRLPRQMLKEAGTLFSPDTILKWHRWLIARKYDGSGAKRPGPPPTKQRMIRDHVLQMAELQLPSSISGDTSLLRSGFQRQALFYAVSVRSICALTK